MCVCVCVQSCTISRSLLRPRSIESVMPSNHHILCRPLHLLPSTFPSIGSFLVSWLFTSGGQSIGASASDSGRPFREHSVLFSSRIDGFDLPAVQGTLKSFLQHHSLKASVLQQSAFFMVQLSHLLIQHHNLKAQQGPLSMEFSR